MNHTDKRALMIQLIDKYLTKDSIKIRHVLKYYRDRLISNTPLKPKHLKHLSHYLKWDLGLTDKQVIHYFGDLTKPSRSFHETNLEPFFTDKE